jgi:hypothetical protein
MFSRLGQSATFGTAKMCRLLMRGVAKIGPLEGAKFVLDIDLDYFHTLQGARPRNPASFRRLIRNAALITVALEATCVRAEPLLDKGMSAKRLLTYLLGVIQLA